MGLLLFVIFMFVIQSGFGFLVSELIMLMIPLGLLGVLISLGALIVKSGPDKSQHKLARIGILLNTLGAAISGLIVLLIRFVVGY